MTREVVASTQYGDLKGTIALDGYGSSFLHDLGRQAGIPADYFPVGLEFYANEPGRSADPISIKVLAVDTSVVGTNGDAVKAFADRKQTVPVAAFPIKLPFTDLITLIKRCSIVISDRLLGDASMVVPADN